MEEQKKVDYSFLQSELKDIFENRVWISKISLIVKIVIVILLITGFLLIFTSFLYKRDFEEFFVIPLIMGIFDILVTLFFINKYIGFRLNFDGKKLTLYKFSKKLFSISLKDLSVNYKKKLFYEVLDFYESKVYKFSLNSLLFDRKDFLEIKEKIFKIKSYLSKLK